MQLCILNITASQMICKKILHSSADLFLESGFSGLHAYYDMQHFLDNFPDKIFGIKNKWNPQQLICTGIHWGGNIWQFWVDTNLVEVFNFTMIQKIQNLVHFCHFYENFHYSIKFSLAFFCVPDDHLHSRAFPILIHFS